jgi:succinate dehydrogenase / fumarate reductase cytochrome b subunit
VQQRPKNLNLFTIRFPLPAIVSILHRISGFILFLLIPVLLWALQSSLSYTGFDDLQTSFSHTYIKLFFWVLFLPYCFHLVAGLRHLLSDLHIGNSRHASKVGAAMVFIIFALIIIFAGVWIW